MGDFALGLCMVVVCGVFFGSNFVVTKKYPTGDGMFFQWVMCAAIFAVGFIVSTASGAMFWASRSLHQPDTRRSGWSEDQHCMCGSHGRV